MASETMTASLGGKPSSPRRRSSSTRIGITLICALIFTFLVGLVGYNLHSSPKRAVRVDRTITGTVTLVGNNGTSGCVQPNGGGRPLCSRFFLTPNTPPLKVGQHVSAAYEWINSGNQAGDLLLIYPTG